jgi:hypothetical protein
MRVVSYFKMEMGSGGPAGVSHQGDFLPLLDPASFFDKKF